MAAAASSDSWRISVDDVQPSERLLLAHLAIWSWGGGPRWPQAASSGLGGHSPGDSRAPPPPGLHAVREQLAGPRAAQPLLNQQFGFIAVKDRRRSWPIRNVLGRGWLERRAWGWSRHFFICDECSYSVLGLCSVGGSIWSIHSLGRFVKVMGGVAQ